MGRKIAQSQPPFGFGIPVSPAEFCLIFFNYSFTAFTLFNNLVAGASVELTSFLAHEMTIVPFLYRSTNHDNHILSISGEPLRIGYVDSYVWPIFRIMIIMCIILGLMDL